MTSETADSTPEQIAPDESREILDRITDAFFALDGQWRFTFVNERAEELLDRPREALLGQNIWNAFPAATDSTFEREYRRALDTQEPSTFEAFYPPLERWFEVRVYPSESGLSVYFQDITEQKKRERELERYETIVETVDDGVYVVDADNRFVLVNDAYCELTGYDREELLGSSANLVVDEETRAAAIELGEELRTGARDRATLEAELQTADGETVPAEATFALLPGEERRRVGVVRDVSDKRRREQRLEEQRDQLEQLVDVNAVVQQVNRAIVGAETRAEIERTVCEHLVDAPEYEVAWIADLDASGERVRPRAGAGVDEATLSELADAEASAPRPGPVTNALRRESVHVIQNVVEDPADPRSELLDEQGCRSSISLPLVHGDEGFGVLTIDSGRRHAYSGTERELLEALADTVGYALHTVEELRRERDVTDQVLETSPVGILVATPGGTITRANDRAHELLGLEVDETGAPYMPGRWTVYDEDGEPIPPEDRLVARTLRTGEPVDREVEVELDDGNVWLSARAVPITTDGEVERVVATVQDITALKERERQLRVQRDELERLDHINATIRSTLESVVAAEDLEELERDICAELVDQGPYRAAWFGDLDLSTSDVVPTTTTGSEDDFVQRFLAASESAADPGPVETAVRSGEVQTVDDVTADSPVEFDDATDPDYRSVAAVPVRYEDSQYGVLVVHAERAAAFDDEVAAVLAELGDAIGLARNALVRREGLLSENVTRIELRLRDALPEELAFDGDAVSTRQTVSVGDGTLLLYLTAEGMPREAVESAAEASAVLGHARLVSETDDTARYELEVTDPPLTETLVAHGGRVRSVDVDGRDYHVVAELPPQVDVRALFGTVEEQYPDVELTAQQSVSRRTAPAEHRASVFERLTDRQREALETAHAAGYFDWPRDSSGEEVADTLGVSPSTFHQHLRVGEQKVLDLIFDVD